MLTTQCINADYGLLNFNHGWGDLFQIESLEIYRHAKGAGKSLEIVVEALKGTPPRCHAMWGVGLAQSPVVQWAGANGFKQTVIPKLYGQNYDGIVCNRLFLRVAVEGCPDEAKKELERYLCPVVDLEEANCALVDRQATDFIEQANKLGKKVFFWDEIDPVEKWPRQVFDQWVSEVFA